MNFANTYGEFWEVHGKKMCVSVNGVGDEVIVIFPFYGSPSPILEMKALVSFLNEKYTVVTVEGFGSGQSDEPDTARVPQNIVKEVHNVLQQLGFSHYSMITDISMVSHCICYAQTYRYEINAIIIMDMRLSKRSKFYMLKSTLVTKKIARISAKISLLRVKGYVYSKQDIYIYALLSALQLARHYFAKDTENLRYDTITLDICVLLLISKRTEKTQNKRKYQVKETFAESKPKKVIFNGAGKIHLRQPEKAAKEIETFLDALKIRN